MWGCVLALLAVSCAGIQGVPDHAVGSEKIFKSFVQGSDTSKELRFTRQAAWDAWNKEMSSTYPNCMRAVVDSDSETTATYCYYAPRYNFASQLTNYSQYEVLTAENYRNDQVRHDVTDPIFGAPTSYVDTALVWGNSEASQDYHNVQGWVFYPLSSPLHVGSSNSMRDSSERINFCQQFPDRCSNIYTTLQLSGGFELPANDKPRPDGEQSDVSWVLVHSKDGTTKNFRVLDSGNFQIRGGQIQPEGSKTRIPRVVSVPDFEGNQHVALWVEVRPSSFRSGVSLESMENNGYLLLKDAFTFRLLGDCKLQCDNGVADLDLCVCVCPNKWTGAFCDECGLKCSSHGNVSKDCRDCICEKPWRGDFCDVCPKTCPNGRLNPLTCECKCQGRWTGERCDVCPLTCEHDGYVDQDKCECVCDQTQPWAGEQCNVCTRVCANGGVLNNQTCECTCPAPWSGPTCLECNWQCFHGAILDKNCSCKNCPLPYTGDRCDKCNRECKNGGKLLKGQPLEDPCKCECVPPWGGDSCDQCANKCNPTSSVSATPEADCSCKCKNFWQGRYCDYCPLYTTMKHGGVVNDDCTRKCPDIWGGDNCEICNITCQLGVRVANSPDQCECKCNPGATGRWCERCEVEKCGTFSPFAGEDSFPRQCDCRQAGKCTNMASADDRWCNTCTHTCPSVVTPLHREAPLGGQIMTGVKQCFCSCAAEIQGATCEIDTRNKAVKLDARSVSSSHSPGFVTADTCTSCARCWNERSVCVSGTESYQCPYQTVVGRTCTIKIFGACLVWADVMGTAFKTCTRTNPCIRTAIVRDNDALTCTWTDTRCYNPINGKCCANYFYNTQPPFPVNTGGTPCPAVLDTFPASRGIDGQCSRTGSDPNAWYKLDLGASFVINQVTLNRGDKGVATVDVYISTSASSLGTKCNQFTTLGVSTKKCSSPIDGRYLTVTGNGEVTICGIDARYVV